VVLRLEDLDGERAHARYVDATLQDLVWLGLDWDETPWLQSTRTQVIAAAALELMQRGLAYACVCSRGDIRSAARAPHAGEEGDKYPGTCAGRYRDLEHALAVTGKRAGLRFRAPETNIEFNDRVAGPQVSNVQQAVGDFLILRRDGIPAYQLAVVVDDAAQGVTEVVRGNDLLSSTGRQIALIEALGYVRPEYYHLPLVVDANGLRLAKRCASLSLAELRARGVSARSIVTWVLKNSGVQVDEMLNAEEACALFSIAKLPSEPVQVTANAFHGLVFGGSNQ
jgi:glutamyl-tRNA synthetase